jgi:O-antigen/teichoic acid export membrane protein
LYELPGFILGQSIAILAVSFFLVKIIPFDFKPKFDVQEAIRLIKVGFPMVATGLLYGFLTTVDRWVIVSFLGVEQLGYYSLAIMTIGFLTLVPMVVAQQIYPRMAETFGRTSSYTALKKWILRQAIIGVGITVPLAVGIYFIFPLVVQRFLSAYVPGIAAMEIILLGLLFLPLAWGFGNFLNTVDKQSYVMAVQGFAILVNLGFNITFVKIGLGINGVALGTALAYMIYGITLSMVGLWVIKYKSIVVQRG